MKPTTVYRLPCCESRWISYFRVSRFNGTLFLVECLSCAAVFNYSDDLYLNDGWEQR